MSPKLISYIQYTNEEMEPWARNFVDFSNPTPKLDGVVRAITSGNLCLKWSGDRKRP